MTESEQEEDRKRSPNYPSISLQTAVAKIAKLYPTIGVNAGTKETLAGLWETTAKSSSFLQTLASLGKYGLLQAVPGTPRKFRLTRPALDIAMLPETDARHVAALKTAALTPKLFKSLWEEHGADVVSDTDLQHLLVTTQGFLPEAATDAIKQYRRNVEFAKLGSGDKIAEKPDDERPIEVGEYVQWESQGVARFPQPRKVTKRVDDWLFVAESPTGFPASQSRRVKAPEEALIPMTNIHTSNTVTPPPNPDYKPPAPAAAAKQYVLTVDTGEVVVRWPESLSDEDYETIDGWLEGLKKKIKRSVKSKDEN